MNRGLPNLGNTCYLNATLQCLFHTYELNEFVLSDPCKKGINNAKKQAYILLAYRRLLENVHQGEFKEKDVKNFVTISFLVSRMLELANVFEKGHQHDMVEFLQFVLNSFHECLSTKVQMTIDGAVLTKYDDLMHKSYKEWITHYTNEYSFLVDLFSGQFFSKIITIDQQAPSEDHDRFDPFMVLSVPVPCGKSRCTLYDCLDLLTASEILEGWKGERFQMTRRIQKTLCLWKIPNLLIIHLKRFLSVLAKNNTMVEIPFLIDVTPYTMTFTESKTQYSLYAIANHVGALHGGHYFAFCKDKNDQWFKYDDASVSSLRPEDINGPANYCLFYRRVR